MSTEHGREVERIGAIRAEWAACRGARWGRFLKATSVGFRPLAWSFAKGADRVGGIDFYEAELLEWSIVPVPANADCTLDAGQLKALRPLDAKRRQREVELLRLRVAP